MGYSEMILTQADFSIYEYAVVALDCLPDDSGKYLGKCRIGKQRTLLLKEI